MVRVDVSMDVTRIGEEGPGGADWSSASWSIAMAGTRQTWCDGQQLRWTILHRSV
jgi:hypothetical protein